MNERFKTLIPVSKVSPLELDEEILLGVFSWKWKGILWVGTKGKGCLNSDFYQSEQPLKYTSSQ
jgi:hypothetical protein